MKNEIKKIMLNGESEIVKVEVMNETTNKKEFKDEKRYNLKGLVVVRENKIETYGFGKISNEELLKRYSKLILELKEQNKEELKDLDGQQSVNKLYELGKIECNDKKVITKITNYLDKDENPIKFVVTSTEGVEEIKLSDCYDDKDYILKFKDKMVEMCNTYDIELDSPDDITEEFIDKLQKMGLLENKGKDFEKIPEMPSEYKTKKEVSTNKINNLRVNSKLISALIAAGVIGLILSTHGCHKKETKTQVTDIPNEDYNESIEWEVVEEALPTVEPIEYFKEIAFPGMDNYKDIDSNDIIIEKINGEQLSYYIDNENLIEIRNRNMSNVANYIQSDIAIEDKGVYIYHENLFNDNLRDKAYVKYFSMIGNQIIKSAYQDNYFRGILDNSIKSDEEVIRLIQNDEPLEACIMGQMEYIRFSELSKSAKEMVLNIVWTNNLPLSKTTLPSGYTQDDISDIILDKSNDLGIIK